MAGTRLRNSNSNRVGFFDKKFPFVINLIKNTIPYRHLHSHPGEIELQYVFSGEGVYIVNNKIYPVKEGMLLVIHRHEYHRIASVNKKKPLYKAGIICSSYIFSNYGLLKPYALKTLFKDSKNMRLLNFEKSESVEVGMVVKGLFKDFTEKNIVWKESIVVGMARLCLLVQKHMAKAQESPKQIKDAVIQGCLDYIDKNISSDLNLCKLSKITGLAPNYLSSKFGSITGISIKNYIIEKRINEAKKRLELNPEVKIIAIAYETGFKDLSNFNHTFKKLTGFTPSDYRGISLR
ncbi:MAG: AraC family transcriptional regulator [Candidatus Firestonebacteria bacterium]